MNKIYTIDEKNIVREEIDNDMVVINLETGCYYSFNKSASIILSLFDDGNSKNAVAKKYMEIFSVNSDAAAGDVSKITEYLIEKKILLKTSSIDNVFTAESNSQYMKPVIDEFDDMQEMLMLDPIHEVKEKGWPYKKDK